MSEKDKGEEYNTSICFFSLRFFSLQSGYNAEASSSKLIIDPIDAFRQVRLWLCVSLSTLKKYTLWLFKKTNTLLTNYVTYVDAIKILSKEE